MNSEPYGLSQEDWQFIKDELIDPLKQKGAKVWLFGSRATGKHSKFSDIDLLYESQDEFSLSFVSELKENSSCDS